MNRTKRRRLKILSFNAEGVAVPYALDEIHKTLTDMGHHVHVVDILSAAKQGLVVAKVLIAIEDFRPDIILTIDLVGIGTPFFFIEPPVKTVSLFFDNPKNYFGGKELLLSFDHYHIFSIEKSYVGQRVNTHYTPWCFAPEVFYDMQLERVYDVSFIGRLDDERRKFFLHLAAFVTVDVWGDPAWEEISHPNIVFHGSADPRTETPTIYNQSKVVICPNAAQFENGISERLYNVMACGACAATNQVPVLEEHFIIGEDLIAFETEAQLGSAIKTLLNNDQVRREMGSCGQKKVTANHTYQVVLSSVLTIVTGRDLDEASFQKTITEYRERNPDKYSELLMHYIRVHYNAQQYAAALGYLSQALGKSEQSPSLYLLTISCLAKLGQQDQAWTFYDLFCEAFPDQAKQAGTFLQPEYTVNIEG